MRHPSPALTTDDYHLLSARQKCRLCSGCGPTGWLEWVVPELIFHSACNRHDFDYFIGGGVRERWVADFRFFCRMLGCAGLRVWWYPAAVVYYLAVVVGGRGPFVERRRPATWADLRREVGA